MTKKSKSILENIFKAHSLVVNTEKGYENLSWIKIQDFKDYRAVDEVQIISVDGQILLYNRVKRSDLYNYLIQYDINLSEQAKDFYFKIPIGFQPKDQYFKTEKEVNFPKWENVISESFKCDPLQIPLISTRNCSRLDKIKKLLGVIDPLPFHYWNTPIGVTCLKFNTYDFYCVMPVRSRDIGDFGSPIKEFKY